MTMADCIVVMMHDGHVEQSDWPFARRADYRGQGRMPKQSHLFSPVNLAGITLPNQIVVSPMCQ
jgi:hypothetical protein